MGPGRHREGIWNRMFQAGSPPPPEPSRELLGPMIGQGYEKTQPAWWHRRHPDTGVTRVGESKAESCPDHTVGSGPACCNSEPGSRAACSGPGVGLQLARQRGSSATSTLSAFTRPALPSRGVHSRGVPSPVVTRGVLTRVLPSRGVYLRRVPGPEVTGRVLTQALPSEGSCMM